MIGPGRISVHLEGDALPVELSIRPADLFAAEDALGFDPLMELGAATVAGALNTRVLRGLIALAWAAYTRENTLGLSLEVFTQRLEAMPEVTADEDEGRPTPAVASTA